MNKSFLKVALALFVGSAILLFLYAGGHQTLSLSFIQSKLDFLRDSFQRDPFITAGLYFLTYVLVTALSLPGAAAMTLLGGAVFGLFWGVVLVSFASSLGASLAFLVSRFLLGDFVRLKFKNRYRYIEREFRKNGSFFVFSVRLVPFIPFFMVNLIFGLTPIKLLHFYFASQMGMLPGTIVYVNAGMQLGQLEAVSGILSGPLIIAFLTLASLPWVSKILLSLVKRKRLYSKFKKPKSFDYQAIVIGAGSAGLVATNLLTQLKVRVALVEKNKMGGDCLNTGCIPSKTLIHSAKIAHQMREASRFGFDEVSYKVDFQKIISRVRSVIKKIEPHDSVERYESLGAKCFLDEAKILSPFEVQVGDLILKTRHIVVATGAKPRRVALPGVDLVKVVTSDDIWNLDFLPSKLLVLGGGAIGCEFAQSFSRLGSKVTLLEVGKRLLSRDDAEASGEIQKVFESEGIDLFLETRAVSFKQSGGRSFCEALRGGKKISIEFDVALMALGREANTAGLGLQEIGVELREDRTISTDECLKTNFPNIWACGDVAGPYQFTHTAGLQGSVVALNILASPFKQFKWEDQLIPWVTYTDPEVAQLGKTAGQAQRENVSFETYRFDMQKSDRAMTEGTDFGFVKVLVEEKRDRIVGVTIVGSRAGEMLSEFAAVIKAGRGLKHIMSVIHAYPTLSEANKAVALEWRRKKTPQWVFKFLKKLNRFRH